MRLNRESADSVQERSQGLGPQQEKSDPREVSQLLWMEPSRSAELCFSGLLAVFFPDWEGQTEE
jgi:hypothetical protein